MTYQGSGMLVGMTSRGGEVLERAGVVHDHVEVDGVRTFFRVAGPEDGPVVVLPHGYPCSSYQFRELMAQLGDRWRLVAPDYPGFGYSATPDPRSFSYTFDGYSEFLQRFVETLGLTRYAIYLQDFGSQFGFRLAMHRPERVAGLIIQNGDIYEDEHGPKYAPLKEFWNNPTAEARARLHEAVNIDRFAEEFAGELSEEVRARIAPDLWTLSWAQLGTPERRENLTSLLADQRHTVPWFARQQAYLREHQPPTLIVWGPHDGYMPEGAARAYLRDLPDAELHLLGGGHWLLETHLSEVVPLVRDFLTRVHP